MRCGAKTAKSRCKRKVSQEGQLCYQHAPKVAWDQKGYPEILNGTNESIAKKIKKRILYGPKKKDKLGYIYIYRLPGEPFFYKIGQTEKNPLVRVKEWSKDAILLAYYVVESVNFCERLIHHYLDKYRVYRYVLPDKSMYSVWKATGKPVKPGLVPQLEGRKKQIEWFKHDLDPLKITVEGIVKQHLIKENVFYL